MTGADVSRPERRETAAGDVRNVRDNNPEIKKLFDMKPDEIKIEQKKECI